MASGAVTDGKKEMEAMKMKMGKSAMDLNALKKKMKVNINIELVILPRTHGIKFMHPLVNSRLVKMLLSRSRVTYRPK